MITAKSKYSETELLQGVKFHFDISSLGKRKLPLVCGVFLLFVFVYQFRHSPFPSWSYLLLILGIIGLCLPSLKIWFAKRKIRRMPNLGEKVTWTFDENQMTGTGDGSSFSHSWDTIHSATLGREGLLIYPKKGIFYWIPSLAFSKPEEFEQARALIRAHVKETKEVES